MGAPMLHVGATLMCPHGGQVVITPGSPRVTVSGQPVATMADQFNIVGCAFTVPGPKPQPCVRIQWIAPALRVRVGGQPVLLQSSTGLCMSAEGIPQGPPVVAAVQPRATAL